MPEKNSVSISVQNNWSKRNLLIRRDIVGGTIWKQSLFSSLTVLNIINCNLIYTTAYIVLFHNGNNKFINKMIKERSVHKKVIKIN